MQDSMHRRTLLKGALAAPYVALEQTWALGTEADADQPTLDIHVHPPTQGVNMMASKHKKFFRLCADLDMVMMVHTGHEHSAPVLNNNKDLANPRRLVQALNEGCTVVACHAGSGWESDDPDQLPQFLKLVASYPKLWGDTAVLGSAGRVRDFRRLLGAGPEIRERLLHGSDFPFPSAPLAFAGLIGKETCEQVSSEANWIKQDFDLKVALGIGRESARRAYRLATATQDE